MLNIPGTAILRNQQDACRIQSSLFSLWWGTIYHRYLHDETRSLYQKLDLSLFQFIGPLSESRIIIDLIIRGMKEQKRVLIVDLTRSRRE